MNEFRKNPATVKAIRWDGTDATLKEVKKINPDAYMDYDHSLILLGKSIDDCYVCLIRDWVVLDTDGVLKPYDRERFLLDFSPVSSTDSTKVTEYIDKAHTSYSIEECTNHDGQKYITIRDNFSLQKFVFPHQITKDDFLTMFKRLLSDFEQKGGDYVKNGNR